MRTTIYFLTDNGTAPIGVRRTVIREGEKSLAEAALNALLAGPSPTESNEGIGSAIPSGVTLRSFSTRGFGETEAVVDLSGLPESANGVDRVRMITEVTRTLVGVSGLQRVWLHDDGHPWGLWDTHGGMPDRPHDYGELLGFYRVCASKPGTETVEGDCFTALP
ncbi:MAG TPA: GerMN domain-containing protein [Chloroflexota bacterium]